MTKARTIAAATLVVVSITVSLPSGALAGAAFIARTCKSADNAQCEVVLNADPRSANATTVRELAGIGIDIAAAAARAGHDAVEGDAGDHEGTPLGDALADCGALYGDAMDSLEDARSSFDAGAYGDAETSASAAEDAADKCEQAFADRELPSTVVADVDRRMKERCGVAGDLIDLLNAVPLYLSEMAPPLHRGAFSNGFQLCVGVGAVTARIVNFNTQKIKQGWGWRLSLALAAVPGGFLTLGALFLPETPNSLLQQGKDRHQVRALLQRIRGVDDVGDELDDMVAAAGDEAKGGSRGLRLILSRRRYRPQLVMAVAIPFFQQVTGINAISFYAPVLLRTIGMGESAALLSVVVTGSVGMASTLLSMLVVDRLGRRTLFLAGGVQMLASQLLIGGIMATQLGDHGQVSKEWALVLITLIAVYVAGFAWSWGPLGWLLPSEVFPLEVRSAGQSIAVAVNFLLTTTVAQAFLAMLCRMKAGIFFFFAAWLVAMTAFVYLLLPETKGLPIEQVERLWGEHWFWKKFVCSEEASTIREKL